MGTTRTLVHGVTVFFALLPTAWCGDENPVRTASVDTKPIFWPDPFPHLGHDENRGRDWMFVRIAGDRQAMLPLKTDVRSQIRIENIWRIADQESLISGTPVEWAKLRKQVVALLTKEQIARVEQLIIQRLGYRAFSAPDVVKRLKLTPEQQEEVSSHVDQHQLLVRDNEAELGRSKYRAAILLEDEKLALRIKDLTAQMVARNGALLRQLWSGIDNTLSDSQRTEFNAIRGPMPESLRAILPKLNGEPGFTRENEMIILRRRGPLPPKSMAVDINVPSDQDVQLAWLRLMYDNGHKLDPDEASKLLIVKEKIVDCIEPPRRHSLGGIAILHHSHYKCTTYHGDDIDVVYLDRTHFHGVGDGEFDLQSEMREQLIRIPIEEKPSRE